MSKNTHRMTMAALAGLLALTPAFAQSAGTATSSAARSTKKKTTTTTTATTTAAASKLSAGDAKFVKTAATGGMEEVELGKLAASKASDPDVKNFGQKMVDDHSKANDQLKQIASQKGVTLPAGLNNMQKHDKAKLEKLSGAAFDRSYISMMVQDHKKDVADFQKESNSGKDGDVKSFASATLPTLQDHLKMAQDASCHGASPWHFFCLRSSLEAVRDPSGPGISHPIGREERK
jgi:putative membrane protein